ncbi:MAG: hypothetical protein ACXVLT_03715 [Flavisolibacter sp.]
MNELSIDIPVNKDFTATFLFYQSPNHSKCRFYVTVMDQAKTPYFFFLDKCRQERWKIEAAKGLPEWIRNLEDDLNEVIAYKMDLEKWE